MPPTLTAKDFMTLIQKKLLETQVEISVLRQEYADKLYKLESKLGKDVVGHEITSNFKTKGPLDVSLMSNIHIDSTLQQWALKYKEFFPYNFNMLNYASYSIQNNHVVNQPDSLA